MKVRVLTALIWLRLLVGGVLGGDTYDCVNSKGDYINYGPPKPPDHLFADRIVGAYDGRRYDRWLPMLSQQYERALIFLEASRRVYERETIVVNH